MSHGKVHHQTFFHGKYSYNLIENTILYIRITLNTFFFSNPVDNPHMLSKLQVALDISLGNHKKLCIVSCSTSQAF